MSKSLELVHLTAPLSLECVIFEALLMHLLAGMVLIRSDSGQLMLVSQQALAQAQGMAPRKPAVPSPSPTPPQVCIFVCIYKVCVLAH